MIIQKPYIFITGAPRSGTSMITKIIDSHPDVGIFMENIFGLRRRHWTFPDYWHNDTELFQIVNESYNKLIEPVVGNKVCTPDIWNTDEILRMCCFFASNKLIFVVRNPVDVINSRLNRERIDHYSDLAVRFLCLDWRNKYYTYISSWRQSIDVYWKLRDTLQEKIKLIYYDDFVCDVKGSTIELFDFVLMAVLSEEHTSELNTQ